jgi:hypothetical protein
MYEYFDVFMKLCTSFDDCILVFKMQKNVMLVGWGYDLYLGNVALKNLGENMVKYTIQLP